MMERTKGTLTTAVVIVAGIALLISVSALSDTPGPKQPRPKIKTPVKAPPVTFKAPSVKAPPKKQVPKGKRLMYTTYFYTANEAVVHGYQMGTRVRIVSLKDRGTVWKGQVDRGQTHLVKTGKGVFAFLSDKKASILVGTPSRCAVVGYWVRDQNGSFRSDHFYSQLPSAASNREKVLVWAWEDTKVTVKDLIQDKVVFSGPIKANSFFEIGAAKLRKMSSSVLEISADKKAASVQVYYDEGFFVPSRSGRAAGKVFHTYVGDITNGVNDLSVMAYQAAARVKVLDLKSDKLIWSGKVAPGKVHTLTLSRRYVRVVSDAEVSVSVAPYKHYKADYMEHHFAAGQEGTGIETSFLLTTPRELWIFSYYDGNPITVTDARTGKQVWKGKLGAGQATGVHPGHGFYRVQSQKGVSVMGGAMACGAEFSPAGGMFKVDEALLKVLKQIKQQRVERAAREGRKISQDELDAPLAAPEMQQAVKAAQKGSGRSSMSEAETKERIKRMKTY